MTTITRRISQSPIESGTTTRRLSETPVNAIVKLTDDDGTLLLDDDGAIDLLDDEPTGSLTTITKRITL